MYIILEVHRLEYRHMICNGCKYCKAAISMDGTSCRHQLIFMDHHCLQGCTVLQLKFRPSSSSSGPPRTSCSSSVRSAHHNHHHHVMEASKTIFSSLRIVPPKQSSSTSSRKEKQQQQPMSFALWAFLECHIMHTWSHLQEA